MAVSLTVDNRFCYLQDAPLALTKLLAQTTSYLVKGHEHAQAFQNGYWDGRKRLLSQLRDGRVRAPVGLAQEVADMMDAREIRYTLRDIRHRPTPTLAFSFDWDRLRPYQRDAVRAATDPQGSLRTVCRGIIKMPPRSGKTFTAAAVIAELRVRALFVVPARSLLHQGRRELSETLGVEVGIVGDGEFEKRDITVATIQTLCALRGNSKKKIPQSPRYAELMDDVDLIIFDELHHLEAEEWRKVIQDSDAAYKIGLSATVFLDHKVECELGVIWLRACTGDILVDLSVSDLIEQGWLVAPDIRLYPIRSPDLGTRGWSQKLQRDAILLNDHRNGTIVDVTRELVRSGMRTVIIANRHEQVDELCGMLHLAGVSYARVVGATKQKQRERAISDLVGRRVDTLIGTVFGEGVDIPELEAVVNAEGGSGIKQTYQRMRCLTACNGKTRAVVVDFVDLTNPYFARHSMERLSVYRSERAFRVSVAE